MFLPASTQPVSIAPLCSCNTTAPCYSSLFPLLRCCSSVILMFLLQVLQPVSLLQAIQQYHVFPVNNQIGHHNSVFTKQYQVPKIAFQPQLCLHTVFPTIFLSFSSLLFYNQVLPCCFSFLWLPHQPVTCIGLP